MFLRNRSAEILTARWEELTKPWKHVSWGCFHDLKLQLWGVFRVHHEVVQEHFPGTLSFSMGGWGEIQDKRKKIHTQTSLSEMLHPAFSFSFFLITCQIQSYSLNKFTIFSRRDTRALTSSQPGVAFFYSVRNASEQIVALPPSLTHTYNQERNYILWYTGYSQTTAALIKKKTWSRKVKYAPICHKSRKSWAGWNVEGK